MMEPVGVNSLAAALIGLQLDYPGEGRILSGMPRIESLAQSSVGISNLEGIPTLEVHPGFYQRYSEATQIYHLRHELYHWLLGHPFQRPQFPDPILFDIAADAIVNAFLSDFSNGICLPFLETGRVMSIHEVYEQLASKGVPEYSLTTFAAHQRWWEDPNTSDLDLDLVQEYWVNRLKIWLPSVYEEQGKNDWVQHIEAFWQPFLYPHRSISWRRELRRFARATAANSTAVHTLHRPSKRYGTRPGLKIQRRHRIVVALDTSGSMEVEDWSPLLRELKSLWKTGTQLEVITFDTQVRQQFTFGGSWPEAITGGGGTDFNAPLSWLKTRTNIDGVVMLTDGQAPAPVVAVSFPILWLFSPRQKNINRSSDFPGKTIQLLDL